MAEIQEKKCGHHHGFLYAIFSIIHTDGPTMIPTTSVFLPPFFLALALIPLFLFVFLVELWDVIIFWQFIVGRLINSFMGGGFSSSKDHFSSLVSLTHIATLQLYKG